MACGAIDFINFIRVDDEGNEILVREVQEDGVAHDPIADVDELIAELRRMAESIEKLPKHVLAASINHFDFLAALWLISEVLAKLSKRE
jgi:hypothetical protein